MIVALLWPIAVSAQAPAPAPAPTAPVPGARFDAITGVALPTQQRFVVPPDYLLGPGDLVEVQITGRLDVQRQNLVIDVAGNVNFPPLGNIEIGGVTVAEATRRVAEKARAFFRFADVIVTLVQPRSFEIAVTGEVQKPGTALVQASRRLQDVISTMGGFTQRASNRRVRVTRDGVTTEYDLLRFELAGDATQNPLVREGMWIHVPPRLGTVTLSGAFRRPGEYEVLPDSSLADLASVVGGLSDASIPSQARFTRLGPDGRRETTTLDVRAAMATPGGLPLKPGDALFVPTIAPLQDVIEVRGAFVGTPESAKLTVASKPIISQRLELAQGDRIRDVVGRLGGATPIADLYLAFVDRTPSAGPQQRIPVNLHKLFIDKDEAQNIVLENGDLLNLPVQEDKIFLNGEMKGTGAVDFRPELTARDYIAAGGGFGPRAKPEEAFVTFRNGRAYRLTDAPALEPGATIVVPEVSVKWWQDYINISNTLIGLISAYVGLYVLFGGATANVSIFGPATTGGGASGTTGR